MPYSTKRITPRSPRFKEASAMHAATHDVPRSTYQAWGGFRTTSPDAYPGSGMWKDTVLVTNAEGAEECFAIGPDGYVWSYEIGGAAGEGAGRLVSTGVSGECFGLGVIAGGLFAVLAMNGPALQFTLETYEGADRWAPPAELSFPARGSQFTVERIITQSRGDNLFLGFIVREPDARGVEQRLLWEAVWAGDRPVLASAPVALACGHAFWGSQLSSGGKRVARG
jgi:hypothetical protein